MRRFRNLTLTITRTMWIKRLFITLAFLVALAAAYFWAALSWNYSEGERAGWVQKFSYKGWLCKTWEGELALVSLPGSAVEKFHFTVRDEAAAQQITKAIGRRVMLHYEEKVGLPTSCFGETRHFVNAVTVSNEIPIGLGVVLPSAAASSAASAASQ